MYIYVCHVYILLRNTNLHKAFGTTRANMFMIKHINVGCPPQAMKHQNIVANERMGPPLWDSRRQTQHTLSSQFFEDRISNHFRWPRRSVRNVQF